MPKIIYNILLLLFLFCLSLSTAVNAQTISVYSPDKMPSNIQKMTDYWISVINTAPKKVGGVLLKKVKTSQMAGLLQKVIRGEVDAAWVRLNDSSGRMQWTTLFSAPGIDGSSALLSTVMWRLHVSYFDDLIDFNQVEVMAFLVMPPHNLRLSKKITGLSYFDNQKIRCAIIECTNFMSQLGVNSYSYVDDDLLRILSLGKIVGMFYPSLQASTIDDRYKEYMTSTPYILTSPIAWQRSVYALVISSVVWNDMLSREERRFIIDNSGESLSERFGYSIDSSYQVYKKESYPFLSDKKVDWSIDDLIRLKKETALYRENIIKSSSPNIQQRLRDTVDILKKLN